MPLLAKQGWGTEVVGHALDTRLEPAEECDCMSSPSGQHRGKSGKKVRVAFRRNRSRRRRVTDVTREAREADHHEIETARTESVMGKGDLSRRRTIVVSDEKDALREGCRRGTVVAVRGLYAEVDDGGRVWQCTVRRVLRTRLIKERHPVTVGDHVRFLVESDGGKTAREAVIETVEPRRGELRRHVGRRVHTIVANVDQAVIVSSVDQPPPKPNLIDRYIVAALAGGITPVVCMNKIDLDESRTARTSMRELLERYAGLGYETLLTSAVTGEGIETLERVLKDKESVIAGQSGVGKSSLLNRLQPGLELKTGDVIEQISKGRHTTSTATLILLRIGGYVVDTPGIRSFDLSMVGRHELEAFFVEFLAYVPDCKFPDCTHTHEENCAVKQAVKQGAIHPQRYESYVRLFEAPVT